MSKIINYEKGEMKRSDCKTKKRNNANQLEYRAGWHYKLTGKDCESNLLWQPVRVKFWCAEKEVRNVSEAREMKELENQKHVRFEYCSNQKSRGMIIPQTLNPSDINCCTFRVKGKGMCMDVSEEVWPGNKSPISPYHSSITILQRRYISQPPMRILCR